MLGERLYRIEPYSRYHHPATANILEKRLKEVTPRVADMRRKLVGIIPFEGQEWVFVKVNDLPTRVGSIPKDNVLLEDTEFAPKKGAYRTDRGIHIVTDFTGSDKPSIFMSCMANPATPLAASGFVLEDGRVPFEASAGMNVQLALLNGIVGPLGHDFFSNVPTAPYFRFCKDNQGIVSAKYHNDERRFGLVHLTPPN
jgi:hypothetical protein